jgi:small subunit ribosomal protein S16
MSVRIRLARTGKRHQPSYRLVAADSRAKRDGKFIEILGHYNPLANPVQVKYSKERLKYWLSQGAQMSDRVRYLVTGKKRKRTKDKSKQKKEASQEEK